MKINEILSSPSKTHFFTSDPSKGSNLNTGKLDKTKSPKISSVQKSYFAKDDNFSHSSAESKDLEDYISKVEKKYHDLRKKEWAKAYKENYRTRYPKDGVYGPEL
jgi:hypothetical protein